MIQSYLFFSTPPKKSLRVYKSTSLRVVEISKIRSYRLYFFFISQIGGGEGVKKAYDLYKDAGLIDITYKLYENDRHEILNEPDREVIYADIASWLKVRVDV